MLRYGSIAEWDKLYHVGVGKVSARSQGYFINSRGEYTRCADLQPMGWVYIAKRGFSSRHVISIKLQFTFFILMMKVPESSESNISACSRFVRYACESSEVRDTGGGSG